MKQKALIIGGGPAGCSAAHQIYDLDKYEIDVIESSSVLGAGVRTQYYGGHPYTFGPRHFLTKEKKVFDYINKIIPMRSCAEHEFISYVEQDNAFYNFPIHMDDVRSMPDSQLILDQIKEAKGVENFKRIIMKLCKTKGECSYYEAKLQFENDVLLNDEFYNEFIGCKIHSKHLKK